MERKTKSTVRKREEQKTAQTVTKRQNKTSPECENGNVKKAEKERRKSAREIEDRKSEGVAVNT